MLPIGRANSARNAEYQQVPQNQQAINILESVSLDKQTPSEAALAINLIYEDSRETSNQQAVATFWSIYSSAIRACGGDGQADKMTRLLIAVQSLPDIEDAPKSPVRDSNNCIYWRDLPKWHITFREYGICT
jgi:hypothetical protein